jgi:hypothetical protein
MATRYQRGIQKSSQTTQWPQDTKGVFRSLNRQHNGHKIPKGYSEVLTDDTMTTRYQRGIQKSSQTTQWPQEKGQYVRTMINKTLHRKLNIK